jgi:hypothetical protein
MGGRYESTGKTHKKRNVGSGISGESLHWGLRDPVRGVFEPRRLCDLDELESAIRSHNFIALLTFVGVPPQTWLAVQLDHKAAQSFNELVSRLTDTAANSGSFWLSQPAPLAMVSGTRTIEAR